MKPLFAPFGLPIGISITIWTIIGLTRFISEFTGRLIFKIINKKGYVVYKYGKKKRYQKSDIAVIIPAHDEEVVIRRCIQAVKQALKPSQIYIASDGSTDKTYRRALMEGCHVSYLKPGRGKGKAMVYLLKRYRLMERYKLIFIIDADTQIDKNCVNNALILFSDPMIGAVFATSQIRWPHHIIPKLSYYFMAYRDRLNRLLQYFFIYGQTWKYTNVNYVIPGFCTIYKSEVLKQLEIDTPGLLIEDFNLAFQVHKKKLCKIGYTASVIGWDQYPDNLLDYIRQIRRWNIGFFQTVKKNGIWPSLFWLSLGFFSIEIFLNSIFMILLPLVFVALFIELLPNISNSSVNSLINFYKNFDLYQELTIKDIFIGVFLIDYLVTVTIGIKNRKPQFLFYGLFFFFMHFTVSVVLLSSIIPGFFGSSKGQWVSPKRHTIGQTP